MCQGLGGTRVIPISLAGLYLGTRCPSLPGQQERQQFHANRLHLRTLCKLWGPLLTRFAELACAEADHTGDDLPRGRNLRLSVELVANLRHKIVHARGTISDRNGFIKHVLTKCGLWNNGRPNEEHRRAVETYLSPNADDCFVTLIEVNAPLPRGAPPEARGVLNPHFDICGWLISDLMAEAVLIHRYVSSHVVSTPAS